MNVTVFGATGAIGQLTVGELLGRGHAVTAYSRNPRKIPDSWRERVHVVLGEMSERDTISSATSGADAVVSTLGPSMDRKTKGLPLVDGTRHILDAMATHGVQRLIGQATPSVLDPRESPTLMTRLPTLMASDRDWTIVRFIAPRNTPKQPRVRMGFYGTDRLGAAVSRADIAAFTAAQVDDDTYIRRAPGRSAPNPQDVHGAD